MSLADVKAMAKSGVGEDVIINQIKSSRTIFRLSAADIVDLRDGGVSDKVLNYMISTPSTLPEPTTTVIQQAPPPAPVETVVVAPAPGYVWVGGEWTWNGRWFWNAGHWMFPPAPHAFWIGGRAWNDGRGWHSQRGHWR